ncbi:unnamed protein product [Somion occarium]|uniref:Uncharacterized protein n=1 Tax=Somion occarium TaxID=3059160 RepID=A0ABP1DDT6_9APHY
MWLNAAFVCLIDIVIDGLLNVFSKRTTLIKMFLARIPQDHKGIVQLPLAAISCRIYTTVPKSELLGGEARTGIIFLGLVDFKPTGDTGPFSLSICAYMHTFSILFGAYGNFWFSYHVLHSQDLPSARSPGSDFIIVVCHVDRDTYSIGHEALHW